MTSILITATIISVIGENELVLNLNIRLSFMHNKCKIKIIILDFSPYSMQLLSIFCIWFFQNFNKFMRLLLLDWFSWYNFILLLILMQFHLKLNELWASLDSKCSISSKISNAFIFLLMQFYLILKWNNYWMRTSWGEFNLKIIIIWILIINKNVLFLKR